MTIILIIDFLHAMDQHRCYWTVICTALNLDTSQKSEPALELINRAVPSVEAHQHRKKFRRKGDKKRVLNAK